MQCRVNRWEKKIRGRKPSDFPAISDAFLFCNSGGDICTACFAYCIIGMFTAVCRIICGEIIADEIYYRSGVFGAEEHDAFLVFFEAARIAAYEHIAVIENINAVCGADLA